MKKMTSALFAVALLAQTGISQQWSSYTNFNQARQLLCPGLSQTLWGATPGGAFQFSCTDTVLIRNYTNTDGLPQIEVNALASDPQGRIWFGTNGGGIARLDTSTSNWNYYSLIDGLVSDTITALICHGSYVFAGSHQGLSFFNGSEWQGYLLSQIFPQAQSVNFLSVLRDTLWIGTDAGLSKGALADIASQTPSWFRDSMVALSSRQVLCLLLGDTIILAGTANGAARLDGSSWSALPQLGGLKVRSILQSGDSLLFATDSGVKLSDHGSWQDLSSGLPSTQTYSIILDSSNRLWCGTDQGLALLSSGSWQPYKFDCLSTNPCSRVACDGSGTTYVINQFQNEISFLREGRWYFYNQSNTGMPFSMLEKIVIDSRGSIYVGSWGPGLFVRNPGGWWRHYTYPSELPAQAIKDILPAGGGIYLALWAYDERDPLCFYSYSDTVMQTIWGPVERMRPNALAWGENEALYVATNELGLYQREAGGNWTNFNTTNSALPNMRVLSLASEPGGKLWVGTSDGLGVLEESVLRRFSGELLSQNIVSIKIDRLQNKWVATDKGLNLITWDNRVLAFTRDNSSLLSNHINEITVAPGDSYGDRILIATDKGLNILYFPNSTIDQQSPVGLAPNPYRPDRDPYFYFYNLPSEAAVSIYTLDGRLLKSMSAPQAPAHILIVRKDQTEGSLVSGIYLCRISSPGHKTTICKLVVLR